VSAIKQACHFALTDGVPIRSLYVAFIVGTVLNLINQGDALWSPGSINWVKIILTYIVPYCVCTYGAVSFRMRRPATAAK
jgi:hypothetical protein